MPLQYNLPLRKTERLDRAIFCYIMRGILLEDFLLPSATSEKRTHGASQDLEHFVCGMRKVYCSCKEKWKCFDVCTSELATATEDGTSFIKKIEKITSSG